MHKYLPSKKFILTAVSIILAGLIIWGGVLLVEDKKEEGGPLVVNTQGKISVPNNILNLDTDGDGLKDWEESLWKTDSKKTDTDGDGTGDFDEIKVNRNPLKPNTSKGANEPNDKIDEQIIADQKKAEEEFNKLNDTQKMSRVLFSQYIATKGSGPLTNNQKQTILSTALGSIDDSTIISYNKSSLKTTTDNSQASLKNYGNQLGQAYFTGSKQENVENELVILDRVIRYENPDDLKALGAIVEGYTNTIEKLAAITVPTQALNMHLALINDTYNLRNSLVRIQNLFTDPLNSIGGMKVYQTSSANLLKDVLDIKNFFIQRNITYKEGEYGFYITNVI